MIEINQIPSGEIYDENDVVEELIFRMSYVHPATGKRVHRKNGGPFPIKIRRLKNK